MTKKNFLQGILSIVMIFGLTVVGCDNGTTSSTGTNPTDVEAKVAVTGIELNQSAIGIPVGKTATLTATITPSDAADKKVTWESDNPHVTVSATGPVDAGEVTITPEYENATATDTAIITVTTEDGNYVKTCEVTITLGIVPVTGVTLDKYTLDILAGETATLNATILPVYATDKQVTWESDNPHVTVSPTGFVNTGKVTISAEHATAGETAIITVTTEDESKTSTCKVTIIAKPVPVTGITE